jgi:hypothetical protein
MLVPLLAGVTDEALLASHLASSSATKPHYVMDSFADLLQVQSLLEQHQMHLQKQQQQQHVNSSK